MGSMQPMSEIMRAGVAGAGVFGGFHAQKYAALPGVRLSAVYDRDAERAAALARRYDAEPFTRFEAFLQAVEVVSIAAVATVHAELGLAALQAGRPVYLEKPLAADLAGAHALVQAAQARGLVLAAGHQERLTLQALGLLAPGAPKPRRIDAVRRGPWSGRGADVSVFLDLMVHDADFALALAGAEASRHTAHGRASASPWCDEGEVEIRFANGVEARLAASRVSDARARSLTLAYEAGAVHIDFLANSVQDGAGLGLPPQLLLADPLGASIARFVAAARGEGEPAVSGAQAVGALALMLQAEAGC